MGWYRLVLLSQAPNQLLPAFSAAYDKVLGDFLPSWSLTFQDHQRILMLSGYQCLPSVGAWLWLGRFWMIFCHPNPSFWNQRILVLSGKSSHCCQCLGRYQTTWQKTCVCVQLWRKTRFWEQRITVFTKMDHCQKSPTCPKRGFKREQNAWNWCHFANNSPVLMIFILFLLWEPRPLLSAKKAHLWQIWNDMNFISARYLTVPPTIGSAIASATGLELRIRSSCIST